MTVTIVAAIAHGGAIGRAGKLPWHFPEDLAHFKALTAGHAVVMGRRTWESIPAKFRPLPGRRNVVLTRGDGAQHRRIMKEGADEVHSTEVETCLRVLGHTWRQPIDVIGGAEVYRAALPYVDRLEVTEVDVEVEGADAWFPGRYPEHLHETCGRHMLDPSPLDPGARRRVELCGRPLQVTSERRGETPELRFVTWERVR